MAVVQYRTKLVIPRKGLCSNWLASLNPERARVKVPIWIKKGGVMFPKTPDTPVIMIGPGGRNPTTV